MKGRAEAWLRKEHCLTMKQPFQVLTKEYYSLQATLDRRSTELEASVREKTDKLETYEKLEMELDDVVMQAADSELCHHFVTL